MVISPSKRFIFIHVPKTGGMSIESILLPYARLRQRFAERWPTQWVVRGINRAFGLQQQANQWINGLHKHATASEIKRYIGEEAFNSYFTFAFVRNPFDWQVSIYHFIRSRPEHRSYHDASRMSFKEFTLDQIRQEASRQVDYVTEGGQRIVDFVGKLESINASFQSILTRLDIETIEIPHKNRSVRSPNYASYYDDQLADSVRHYYRRDFEEFGYEFGLPPE